MMFLFMMCVDVHWFVAANKKDRGEDAAFLLPGLTSDDPLYEDRPTGAHLPDNPGGVIGLPDF